MFVLALLAGLSHANFGVGLAYVLFILDILVVAEDV